jgi:dTDP-4-amino-4,6-dideoxygalactose transaminase
MTNNHSIIPLVDLATQSQAIRDEVLQRMARVIDAGRYILGEEVEQFENEFARYCQTQHAIGVANGTDALHLALRALDIGPGDEVITVGNSFAATAFAIAYTGAKAVFVDIDPTDYNIDVNLIEKAITPKMKAIIPVHLYGQPARMVEICDLANRHGLRVVEDCAQSHGAEIHGKRCGSFGDIGCWSFYPGKNLGAFGDGGGITTNDTTIAEKLLLLRNYGQKVKNRHDLLGYNCRLDTLQACVLLTKMQYIERWTEQRRQVAAWYAEELEGTPLALPQERDGVRHVYHLYVVRHPQRDLMMKHLAAQNIFCGIHYPNPLYTAQPFAGSNGSVPHLPVCIQYATEIHVSRVGDAIRSFSGLEVARV